MTSTELERTNYPFLKKTFPILMIYLYLYMHNHQQQQSTYHSNYKNETQYLQTPAYFSVKTHKMAFPTIKDDHLCWKLLFTLSLLYHKVSTNF